MVTCKPSDYLTISLIPDKDNNIDYEDFINLFIDTMYLSDIIPLMQFKCTTAQYEQILRYEDIQVKIPYFANYKKQGICMELSGNGVNYYIEWLKTKYNTCLRTACKRFYSLALKGFKCNCSRFDVAFDEKIENPSETKYLDIDVIQQALLERRFVSCFRKADPDRRSLDLTSALDTSNSDSSLHCDFLSSQNLSNGRVGKTIQLGKRSSTSLIRFYDKYAEQEVKGYELPKNLSSWVRCECEFKKHNANSILMKFVELSEKEFVIYCSGVLLNLIRFIELDRSRKYNCSVCEWWSGFLNHAKRAKLVHFKPKYNKYVRALEHQKKQNAASLCALVRCNSYNLFSILQAGVNKEDTSKTSAAIISDYNALQNLSPDEFADECERSLSGLSGFEFMRLFTTQTAEGFKHWLEHLEKETA